MKKSVVFFSLFSFFYASAAPFVIDTIEAVVFGHEETVLVTKLDVERPTLDGVFRSLDDVLMEKLMLLEAKKYKILPDENTINSYLETVQRENNLSQNDLNVMFSSAGYTIEEGRAQLGIMFSINSLMDFKVRSRLIVMEKDVQAHYDANPVYQEASYELRHLVVPFDEKISRKKQKNKIERKVKTGIAIPDKLWSSSFWVDEADIAADKQFIISMQPKTISFAREVDQGFELFELLDSKKRELVSFENRYQEISNILRKPLYEKLFNEFQKELINSSSIVRL
ncbi:hypothetical protein KAH94_02765 [bacterium]|nr:hypothetical protein [bacterium]